MRDCVAGSGTGHVGGARLKTLASHPSGPAAQRDERLLRPLAKARTPGPSGPPLGE